MKQISFKEIVEKINEINFDNFDLIIAIGKGGIIPAALVADKLSLDMKVLWINYRDENHRPRYDNPKQTREFEEIKDKNILLVDDVSRTGKTLNKAKEILKNNKVKTFVLNGPADYNLMDSEECVKWPWK